MPFFGFMMFAPFNLRRFVGEASDMAVLTDSLELYEGRSSLFIKTFMG